MAPAPETQAGKLLQLLAEGSYGGSIAFLSKFASFPFQDDMLLTSTLQPAHHISDAYQILY